MIEFVMFSMLINGLVSGLHSCYAFENKISFVMLNREFFSIHIFPYLMHNNIGGTHWDEKHKIEVRQDDWLIMVIGK